MNCDALIHTDYPNVCRGWSLKNYAWVVQRAKLRCTLFDIKLLMLSLSIPAPRINSPCASHSLLIVGVFSKCTRPWLLWGVIWNNLQLPNDSKMHMPVGYLYDGYLDRKEFWGRASSIPPKNSSCLGHRKGADTKAQLSFKYSVTFCTSFVCELSGGCNMVCNLLLSPGNEQLLRCEEYLAIEWQ